ncbi:MAG: GGDEF domain-containing protein [Acidobacteria bacterium]|nr:GGDEF domain-containing protein [Acidobacteriota bacterium]
MNTNKNRLPKPVKTVSQIAYVSLGLASLVSLIATFLLANSAQGFTVKIAAFSLILVAYLVLVVLLHSRFGSGETQLSESEIEGIGPEGFQDGVEEKLAVLEEAGKIFSASLKSDDMFRLISSRIDGLIPHSACVLFLADLDNRLNAAHASGENARAMTKTSIECDQGIAGRAFISGEVEVENDLTEERKYFVKDALAEFSSAISAPLIRGVETFGVLVMFGRNEEQFGENEIALFEALAARIAPLLVSSYAFEQNIANSMTDPLTNLPNERAFYLVLENQIAEAQRFQQQRHLTILTIDIKGFADFNRLHGHSMGDNLLRFASDIIGGQLRKMDFLCRSMNDEFWVVLPTASDSITAKIVKRIEDSFANRAFDLLGEKTYHAGLNFGSATFLRDGETTNQLLQKALLKKKQTKPGEENTVIMFPREYVN